MNTALEDIPMSVTVCNQKFIEDIMATSTDQLMAYEPSATVVGKMTENDAFIARGSTSVGTNYLDGFPQATGFTSQPLANIERVEVIKGPDAVLYGSGNYGATIDRITKKPLPNPADSLRTIFSDYHSSRSEYDINTGKVPFIGGQSLMYRVDGAEQRGYSWFGQRIREDNVSPSVAWQPDPNDKLVVEFFYDWIDNQASWETPVHNGNPEGIVTGDGVFHEYSRRENYNYPSDFRHVTREVTSADYTHIFSDHLQIRTQAQYAGRDQHDIESFAENAALTILKDTVLVARTRRQQDAIARNYNWRAEAVGHWNFGPINERILAGMAVIDQYVSTHNQQAPSNYGPQLTGTALTGNGRNTSGGSEFNYFPTLTFAQFEANPNLAGYNTNLLMPLNLLDRGTEPGLPPVSAGPTNVRQRAVHGLHGLAGLLYANNQVGTHQRPRLPRGGHPVFGRHQQEHQLPDRHLPERNASADSSPHVTVGDGFDPQLRSGLPPQRGQDAEPLRKREHVVHADLHYQSRRLAPPAPAGKSEGSRLALWLPPQPHHRIGQLLRSAPGSRRHRRSHPPRVLHPGRWAGDEGRRTEPADEHHRQLARVRRLGVRPMPSPNLTGVPQYPAAGVARNFVQPLPVPDGSAQGLEPERRRHLHGIPAYSNGDGGTD